MKKLVVLAFLLIALPAHATSYYVSAAGSDSNSGDSTHPFRTVQHGADVALPGDIIAINAGNYDEVVYLNHSGVNGSNITIQGCLGTNNPVGCASGGVVGTGAGAKVRTFQQQANYWTVTNMDVSNQTAGSSNPLAYGVYFATGASHNLYRNNYVHELCQDGIYIDWSNASATGNAIVGNKVFRAEMSGVSAGGTNTTVDINDISDTQQYPRLAGGIYSVCTDQNGADADYIRFFNSGGHIERNYMHDIVRVSTTNISPHPDCFQSWNASGVGAASNVTAERNFCSYPTQSGSGSSTNHMGSIEDWAGTITFKNNIVVNAYQGLIFDNTDTAHQTFQPIHFYDNTMDNVYAEGIEFDCGAGSCTASDLQVKGNIFNEVGHNGDSYLCAFSSAPVVAANVFHMRAGNNGTYSCNYGSTPSYINAADPMFIDNGTLVGTQGSASVSSTSLCDDGANKTGISTCANYHLMSSSPDIANGITLSGVTNDYYGVTRPNPPSTGAVQF